MTNDFLKRSERNHSVKVRFINKGVNGDLTSDMLFRFRQDVITLRPNYVIILGGTNDIGWDLPIEEIFSNLKEIFEVAIENNIEPIGCSVPSILGWDERIPSRLKLNRLLKLFCHEKKVLYADLFAKTCDPKTKRLRSDYSNNGIHLNALGYKKMAETLFEESLKDLLIRELNINMDV